MEDGGEQSNKAGMDGSGGTRESREAGRLERLREGSLQVKGGPATVGHRAGGRTGQQQRERDKHMAHTDQHTVANASAGPANKDIIGATSTAPLTRLNKGAASFRPSRLLATVGKLRVRVRVTSFGFG